jgi:hypothetical protein
VIVTADSVTQLGDVAGRVLVAGSHGGIVAAQYAAHAGVRAVVLHDAGIGKDEAGVAGLALLEEAGIAAAAVAHGSARIGDGADMLTRGLISRVNGAAARCGVRVGQQCREAAVLLCAAPLARAAPAPSPEGRHELAEGVIGCDSIGMVRPEDAGRILVIGSHAALHGGRPDSALAVVAALAFFHEAGGDTSRLPVLEARGIPAAAVARESARIGDARSLWETGTVVVANRGALSAGVAAGMSVRSAARAVTAAQKKG